MTRLQKVVHGLFLFAMPLIVAWYGFSIWTAILLVVVMLLWRQAITMMALMASPKGPELELETISASHFVEKARWCLDRLGVEYRERPVAGILGVMFRGRTVPLLRMRTGKVTSSIGNSAEILRYLWGRYGVELGGAADFLEPTPERVEWEKRIDDYGVQLQVWVYSHALGHRSLTLHAWGCNSKRVPLWQRGLIIALYPLLAAFIKFAFKLSEGHYKKATRNIEEFLEEVEKRLVSGQGTLLGGSDIDFVDISFASMTGLWLQPQNFGGGAADEVMLARAQLPTEMKADVERWIDRFPNTERYVQNLYRDQRVRKVA